MPLRVGLNLMHLVPGETGGSEIYARRLVPALLEAGPGLELVAFAGREAEPVLRAEPWGDDVAIVRIPVDARSRALRVLAEQTLLPAAARRARISLLHNLFTTAPVVPAVPQVTTILDVIYKRFPETHAGAMRHGMAVLVPLAARRSKRVITISEAAKRDIVRFLGVSADRVDVTYLGPGMAEDTEALPEHEVREQLALADAPIVLTVSAKRPHKNLKRLFEAFTRLETAPPPVLVVPGYATPFEDELRRYAGSLKTDRIRFTGWLDDAMLAGLYAASCVFVFPSLAEGFGLPVLEAMRRGVPVACSDAASLPEVGGEAALYFDPTDVGSIAEATKKLLLDGRLREHLRAAGREQARRFSWKATAEATLASYARALEPAASSIASSS